MIFFKVDANDKIGGGHLHRCIAIAKECKGSGQEITFIFTNTPSQSIDLVKPFGFKHFQISAESELDPSYYIDIIPKKSFILFDTDNYHFYGGSFIEALKNNQISTGCYTITDKYPITTDLLINTNIISRTHTYQTPNKTIKLLGPKYLVFGKYFQEHQVTPRVKGELHNLFLFFGNADSQGLTLPLLQLINEMEIPFKTVHVLVGKLNPKAKKIEHAISELDNATYVFHYNTSKIHELYENTDVAITAAGMSMWEMAIYEIPQIVIASSQREIDYTQYLDQIGYIHQLGTYRDIDTITSKSLETAIHKVRSNTLKLNDFKNSIDPNGITEIANNIIRLT